MIFPGFLISRAGRGYEASESGYFSKCHLCVDIRKYLVENGEYIELSPAEYYRHFG